MTNASLPRLGAGDPEAPPRGSEPAGGRAAPTRPGGHAARIFAELAFREGAISIDPERTDFLASRLARRLAATGFGPDDFDGYAGFLAGSSGAAELPRFIEALTTHTTGFFREGAQFEWLAKAGLPELMMRGAGRLHELVVWSAACSSGEELCTALMVVAGLDEGGLRYRGVGTDLSGAILAKARAATYSGEEIAGIPDDLRRRFLLRARSGEPIFRVAPTIRRRCSWKQANLARAADLAGIEADIAFLRNVLIYFDAPTRRAVLANVLARVRPGGYLLTGHTETLRGIDLPVTQIRPSIYRRDA